MKIKYEDLIKYGGNGSGRAILVQSSDYVPVTSCNREGARTITTLWKCSGIGEVGVWGALEDTK